MYNSRFTSLLFTLGFISLNAFSQTASESFKLGKEQFAIGNFTAALEQFDKAIKTNPSEKEVCFYAGLAEYNLKNYPKAVEYFNKEIGNDKKNPRGYIYRAKARQNSYRLALRDLKRAEKLAADKFTIWYEKANVYYNQKKYAKAFKTYLVLLELKPGFEEAYYKLGFCKYYLKDNTSATKYWSKIDDPDDFENFEIIEKVCGSVNSNNKS